MTSPHRLILFIALVLAGFFSLPRAEPSAQEAKTRGQDRIHTEEARRKAVEEEAIRISKLLGKGNSKTAIKRATKLGQGDPCHLPHNVFSKPRSFPYKPDEATKPFRYFADLGVALRKNKRYDLAAKCVHRSAEFSNTPPRVAAVLYEANLLLPHLSKDGVIALVGFDIFQSPYNMECGLELCADFAIDVLSCPFRRPLNSEEKGVSPPLSPVKIDPWAPFFIERSATMSDPDKSPAQKQKAFKQFKAHLALNFSQRSFEHMPGPEHARRLRDHQRRTQREIEDDVTRGFAPLQARTTTYASRAKAAQAIRQSLLQRQKQSTKVLCKNRQKARDSGLNDPGSNDDTGDDPDCLVFVLKTEAKREVAGGSLELARGILNPTFGSCFPDDGYAYLIFGDPKTKKTTVTELGEVGPYETCGSANSDHFSNLEMEQFSSQSSSVQIIMETGSLVYGWAVQRSCSVPPFQREVGLRGSRHELWCQINAEGKPACLDITRRQENDTLHTFPTFHMTAAGQLKPEYDTVSSEVWAPLAPLLTGDVQHLLKNLPTIREKLREAFRPRPSTSE